LAVADLEEIWDFYAEHADVDVADRMLDHIQSRTADLLEFPELGAPANELGAGRRRLVLAPHVVFYGLEGDAIQILRVLHGRQDWHRAVVQGRD
jgi:toxin ParE1/3/4